MNSVISLFKPLRLWFIQQLQWMVALALESRDTIRVLTMNRSSSYTYISQMLICSYWYLPWIQQSNPLIPPDNEYGVIGVFVRPVSPNAAAGSVRPVAIAAVPEQREASIPTTRPGAVVLGVLGSHPPPRVVPTRVDHGRAVLLLTHSTKPRQVTRPRDSSSEEDSCEEALRTGQTHEAFKAGGKTQDSVSRVGRCPVLQKKWVGSDPICPGSGFLGG